MYGLTELFRDKVKGARLIANPGCYPTCSQVMTQRGGGGGGGPEEGGRRIANPGCYPTCSQVMTQRGGGGI